MSRLAWRQWGWVIFFVVLSASFFGCGDDTQTVRVQVQILDAEGQNPVASGDFETVRVQVKQGEQETQVTEQTIVDGSFALTLPFELSSEEVSMRVEFIGPDRRLVGSSPPFVPNETGRLVRVLVGESGVCQTLSGSALEEMQLSEARSHASAGTFRTFAVMAGGQNASGNSSALEYFDTLQMASGVFDPNAGVLGRTQLTAFGSSLALILSDQRTAFLLHLFDAQDRFTQVQTHAGANASSTVVQSSDAESWFVVGGGTREASSAQGTELNNDGELLRSFDLMAGRFAPVVRTFDDALWVIGGASPEAPVAERIPLDGSSAELAPLEFPEGTVFYGSKSRSLPGTNAFWILGGSDEDGAPLTTTWVVQGCPLACEVSPGPEWSEARTGVTWISSEDTATGQQAWFAFGGNTDNPDDADARVVSTRVDAFVLRDGLPTIERAMTLSTGRSSPVVWRSAPHTVSNGMWFVAGGVTAIQPEGDEYTDSVEVCFP